MTNEAKIGSPYLIDNGKTWELGIIVKIDSTKKTGNLLIEPHVRASLDANGQLASIETRREQEVFQPKPPHYNGIRILPHPDLLGK